MTAQELLVKVKTLFEGKGTQDAAKAVEGLGEKGAEAGKKIEQSAKGADKAVEKVGKTAKKSGEEVNSGYSKAKRGIDSVSKAVGTLNKMVGLFGVIGLIGSLKTAYTTLKGIGDWIKDKITEGARKAAEAATKLADSLSSQKLEEGRRMVESVAEGFNRVEKAISAARAAQSELAAAWQDLNKAGQEVTDTELARREKAELARLSPDDQAGQTRVKNKYAAFRADTALTRRAGDAIRAEQAAQDDFTAASERRANAQSALGQAVRSRDILADILQTSENTAMYSQDKAVREHAAKEVPELTKQVADFNKTIIDLTDRLAETTTSERAAGIRLDAARLRGSRGMDAAEALTAQDRSDLERDTARAQWGQRLTDLRSRASSAASALGTRAGAIRAASDAYAPVRADYRTQDQWNAATVRDKRMESSAKGAEQLAASADKLNEQLSKMKPEQLAAVFDSITRQLAQFDRAIKNAEARTKRQ
ncbi:MAG TPA: hypothetical protein P5026_07945 [Kiritimatiellia bacterium]|nr:hypothetical protein [Kiritimatiellia bacterium]HRU10240.1 hypothetical protein [Thermoanaerobaculia bacterium]